MDDNTIREINKRGKSGRERETWIKATEEEILQQSSIQPRTKSPNLA